MENLRSSLGRARGLGAAKDGTRHWLMQRVSAVALVPLVFWFACAVIGFARMPRAEIVAWFASPGHALAMILFLIASFYHGFLGIQVVIEDYVRHHGAKFVLLTAAQLLCFAAAVAGIFSVLSLYFMG